MVPRRAAIGPRWRSRGKRSPHFHGHMMAIPGFASRRVNTARYEDSVVLSFKSCYLIARKTLCTLNGNYSIRAYGVQYCSLANLVHQGQGNHRDWLTLRRSVHRVWWSSKRPRPAP